MLLLSAELYVSPFSCNITFPWAFEGGDKGKSQKLNVVICKQIREGLEEQPHELLGTINKYKCQSELSLRH